jgi:Holliday junction resolvase RusA-like endonuclease
MEAPGVIELTLPYPPSVNHYYRHVGFRTLISRQGRAYRTAVCSVLRRAGIRPLSGPVELKLELYPPDRRRRDLDNVLKGLLDALQHGGLYHDDSQVVRLEADKLGVVPDGKVLIQIQERN